MEKDFVSIFWGDSICYGKSDNIIFGWVNRLLSNVDIEKNYFFNLAIPGQGSLDIVDRFESELNSRYNSIDEYKLIFSFGIKDALLLNKNKEHINIFKANIEKIIDTCKKYTNNIYFLGLLDVDYNKRKEYNKENVEVIDNIIKDCCLLNNVCYINMKDIINVSELYDGLHPNHEGHEKISRYIYDKIYKNY